MKTMKRRDFLLRAAAGGIALSAPLLSASRTHAAPYEGPCFAIFNAQGGLDQTYLTDPRGTELNRRYEPGEIENAGAIRYAPTAGRMTESSEPQMSNADFMGRYGDQLIVVNGMDCSINNHAPCSRYIATGKLNSLEYPTFGALVAAASAPEVALPFLSFGNYGGTGNLIAATRLPYTSSLRSLGEVGTSYLSPHEESQRLIVEALGEVEAAGHSLPARQRARSFLHAAQINSETLSIAADALEAPTVSGRDTFEIALAAFRTGMGVSANFNRATFDSHANNDNDQLKLIPELLADVDYFVQRAIEVGIADRLVVIIQSEMGRTPWYNGNDGKDHWSINSMMLMRPGRTENRVIGATRVDDATENDLFPETVDPATLALSDSGIRIRPEHIHDALRRYAGIETHEHSEAFSLEVPEDERLQGLFSS